MIDACSVRKAEMLYEHAARGPGAQFRPKCQTPQPPTYQMALHRTNAIVPTIILNCESIGRQKLHALR